MICVGIDPGTPVTVAVLSPDGTAILDVFDGERLATFEKKAGRKTLSAENSPQLLAECLRPYAALGAVAVVERVSPRPDQGIASTARFVGSMYLAQGVAVGIGMGLVRVTPAAWKRYMGLSSDKERSRALALEMWPQHAGYFRRKGDHDRAEAALMALWAIRAHKINAGHME